MQFFQERQNNASFSFYQSTFRVMTWYPSWYPNFQHWPMSFVFFLFSLFFFYIIVSAWIFIYLICFKPWQSLFIFMLIVSHLALWKLLQISSWVFLTWPHLSLNLPCFPVQWEIPGLFCAFPILDLVSDISSHGPGSFWCEMVFRDHSGC